MKDMDSLSSDQRLLCEYTVDISRGKVDPRFASWKIGPLNQARWLTLAIRLMCLWTRGAYPQNLSTKLYSLINFFVNVYAICWFDIKTSNKFHHQQIYICNMIDRVRKKPIEVQRITLKNLQYNALALLLENVLFSMVKFDEPEVREEGIKRILAIRYVNIYSYKTGWSTCANLLKHFKDYIWFHQILLKQNKLHLKLNSNYFLYSFRRGKPVKKRF